MHIRGQAGSLLRLIALGKQGKHHSRQHITAASRCHTRIAGRVEKTFPGRSDNGRISAFQDDMHSGALRQLASLHQAFVRILAFAYKTLQFLGVRSQNTPFGQTPYIVTLLAQQVQGISIHHHRSLAYLYLLQQSRLGLCRLSQSRTYRHGLVIVRISSGGKAGVADVQLRHGFGHGSLHNEVVAERHMHRQQPHPRTQTSTRSQHRSSRHSLRTGYQQCTAEVPLMGKPAARLQQGRHIFMLQQAEVRFHVMNGILAESDVQ